MKKRSHTPILLVFLIVTGGIIALFYLNPYASGKGASAKEVITIETFKGRFPVTAELALTPAVQQRGLMFRESLPEEHGMLFIFDETREIKMWMKNTLIPLDMIFLDKTGKVVSLTENTTPESLATISSGQPARAVLELNAGAATRYGIKPGDYIRSDYFGQP